MWKKTTQYHRPADQVRSHARGEILDEQAFWQIVRVEKERADRSGLPVTVAVFTVKEDSNEHTEFTDKNALSLCQLLSDTARITDHIGIAGANELGVVLWGTRELGAYRFLNRLGKDTQWLADRCHLFVYPELKPLTESGAASGQGGKHGSKNASVPQGILNRIAEVEQNSFKAIAVETSSAHTIATDDFDESYSFGFTDQTADLPKEIDEAANDAPQHVANEADDQPPSSSERATAEANSQTLENAKSSAGGRDGVGFLKPMRVKVKAAVATKPAVSVPPDSDFEHQVAESHLNVQVEPLENLFLHPFPRWKRTIDLVGAVCGLVLMSPVLLGVACLIKLTSPGPVLFRQLQEGYGGKLFKTNKFRTVKITADAEKPQLHAQSQQDGRAFKMANDPRMTWLGSFLRKTCLDELPQLWNVAIGNMTFMGPPPQDHRKSGQAAGSTRRCLNVMPGLISLWQVHGKSKVTLSEWMRMDIRYSQRTTFGQNIKLFFATLKQVFLSRASH